MSILKSAYPWAATPIIINAPMAGFAGAALACAVTKAKGIGFIGGADLATLSKHLEEAGKTLSASANDSTIPIGVGFLTFIVKLDDAAAMIAKSKPAIVWLFAAHELDDYAVWTKRMRAACPDTKIWVQIGSVTGAVEVAKLCKPDVLVMQGVDAGGHGWEKGASVISLLPETQDALAANGFGHVPLLAAGGIADGRGAAAALALGAEGVVLGTRFLGTPEVTLPHRGVQDAILATRDGGQNTVRAKVFDELKGPNIWPELFDGRGVITDSYNDYTKGMSIEENRRLLKEAGKSDGGGYEQGNRRTTVWAGTGVGLVTKVQPAGEIVKEVREDAKAALERARSRM